MAKTASSLAGSGFENEHPRAKDGTFTTKEGVLAKLRGLPHVSAEVQSRIVPSGDAGHMAVEHEKRASREKLAHEAEHVISAKGFTHRDRSEVERSLGRYSDGWDSATRAVQAAKSSDPMTRDEGMRRLHDEHEMHVAGGGTHKEFASYAREAERVARGLEKAHQMAAEVGHQEREVYRGMNLKPEAVQRILDSKVVDLRGMDASASTVPGVAGSFMGRGGQKDKIPVMLQIQSRTGLPLGEHSHFASECEVLLNRRSQYEVTGFERITAPGGREGLLVQMRETAPKEVLRAAADGAKARGRAAMAAEKKVETARTELETAKARGPKGEAEHLADAKAAQEKMSKAIERGQLHAAQRHGEAFQASMAEAAKARGVSELAAHVAGLKAKLEESKAKVAEQTKRVSGEAQVKRDAKAKEREAKKAAALEARTAKAEERSKVAGERKAAREAKQAEQLAKRETATRGQAQASIDRIGKAQARVAELKERARTAKGPAKERAEKALAAAKEREAKAREAAVGKIGKHQEVLAKTGASSMTPTEIKTYVANVGKVARDEQAASKTSIMAVIAGHTKSLAQRAVRGAKAAAVGAVLRGKQAMS